MTEQLEKKVKRAIRFLQSIPQDGTIELAYSTGKDSDVILELAKMSGIPFKPIYKNTTIDRPGSIAHAKEMGVEIVQPKKNMFQIIEKNGWPSRTYRICCSTLKEYKIHDRVIIGIRRAESTKRAKRYKEPEVCRVYSKKEKVRQYLPILDWTDGDVEEFIRERGIKCHPYYYDEQGNFHVERRVGCIGCPLKSDNGKGEFVEYPRMFKAWVKAFCGWWNTHPNSGTHRVFSSVYDALYFKIFCKDMSDYYGKTAIDLWGNRLDTKAYLEEYFKIEL